MKTPQAELDAALVSEARDSRFDSDGEYHLVVLSHPRTWERQMLLTTFVPDWHTDICFYTVWDTIDSAAIRMHVLWKFSADPNYILQFKAKCDIHAASHEQLKLNNWRFT